MAHSENIISQIKLPNGTTYEVHDANAIHDVSELGLSAALVFKGTKATVNDLPATAKVGDVWHVTLDDCEYVWTDAGEWEALGSAHDVASSAHIHNVTVEGSNTGSTVTGSVVVPTVTATKKYLTGWVQSIPVTTSSEKVLGTDTTFTVSGGNATTTKLKATASGVVVDGDGTATAITGFGAHTTANAITALNTTSINNPTATDVSIPNVTGNTSVTASKVTATAGTAASWGASVSNGVLSFAWSANTPTAVSASDVTASKVTLGTALSASKVTTSAVTVATGSKTTAKAITTLGTPTTAEALTGVKVTTQPSVTLSSGTSGDVTVATGVSAVSLTVDKDEVSAYNGIDFSPAAVTFSTADTSGENSAPVVTAVELGSTNSALVNGYANAQKWEQTSASVSAPREI